MKKKPEQFGEEREKESKYRVLTYDDYVELYEKGTDVSTTLRPWAQKRRRELRNQLIDEEGLEKDMSSHIRKSIESLFAHYVGLSSSDIRTIKEDVSRYKRKMFSGRTIREKVREHLLESDPNLAKDEKLLNERLGVLMDLFGQGRGRDGNRSGAKTDPVSDLDKLYRKAAEEFQSAENNSSTLHVQINAHIDHILDAFEENDSRDAMTLMWDRGRFLKEGRRALSDAENNGQTLVFFNTDADLFKGFNDAFGHDVGDVVLQTIAQAMLSFARENNISTSRVGGEEMTSFFLKPDVDTKKLLEPLKDRISKALDALFDEMQNEIVMTPGNSIKQSTREIFINSLLDSRGDELTDVARKHKDFHSVAHMLVGKKVIEDEQSFSFPEAFKATEEKDALRHCRDALRDLLPLGTVTMGAMEVDCSRSFENFINRDDYRAVQDWVNGSYENNYIRKEDFDHLFQEYLKSGTEIVFRSDKELTYVDFKSIVQSKIAELKSKIEKIEISSVFNSERLANYAQVQGFQQQVESWEHLLEILYDSRFGRIIQYTDRVQEDQKKVARDSIGEMGRKSLHELDHDFENSTEAIQDIVYRELSETDRELRRQLDEYKESSYGELGKDPRLKRLGLIYKSVKGWFSNREGSEDDYRKKFENIYEQRLKYDIEQSFRSVREGFEGNQKFRYYEALTGSFNNNYLNGIVSREMVEAYRKNEDYTIVSYDFDNLKAVNATGGYFAGDVVLRECAKNTKEVLKDYLGAQLIRVAGGEEFVVKFPGFTSERAKTVMEEINKKNQESVKDVLSRVVVPASEAQNLFDKIGISAEEADGFIDKDVIARGYKQEYTGIRVVSNLTLYDLVQIYIAKHSNKQGVELEKIGTVTAVAVNIQDIGYNPGQTKLNIHGMRGLADGIGEDLKKRVKDPKTGETYKGSVITLADDYAMKQAA